MNKNYICDDTIELRLSKIVKSLMFFPVAYHYDIFILGSDELVGRCDYRRLKNKENYYAGNIGYMIYRIYRGNHYAYRASKLLCKLAANNKEKTLYITCSPENTASYKTIVKLGAEFIEEAEVPQNHFLYKQGEKIKDIFLIKLKEVL